MLYGGFYTIDKVGAHIFFRWKSKDIILFILDLDQLNHILGILGSPGAEDLSCIINEKVSTSLWLY